MERADIQQFRHTLETLLNALEQPLGKRDQIAIETSADALDQVQGATNRDVATLLHLSLHTVKNHVHNAFAKLGINSRAQLPQLMRGSD